jgi:hypothetical protein
MDVNTGDNDKTEEGEEMVAEGGFIFQGFVLE